MNSSLPLPDSLTGAIMAVEGIRDAAVLLNGPTGCKFYHGAVSEGQLPREGAYDPLRFSDEFYFGQPRVPATYLDRDDYVFGAASKLERILPAVAAKGHAMMAVINAPGAALIGDDLERFVSQAGLSAPCVTIESTAYSGEFGDGFTGAVIAVLEALKLPAQPVDPHAVVLSGLCITQRYWEGDVAELERLLGLCGVRVAGVLMAGTTVAALRTLRRAALNVVVHEDLGARPARWLSERFGLEALVPTSGAPIGFDQSEAWVQAVCDRLNVEAAPAIAEINRCRARALMHLKRLNSLTGLPKGATFAIQAPSAVAAPLSRWLREYLGMIPVAVCVTDVSSPLAPSIAAYLEQAGEEAAWGCDLLTAGADLVFADGATLARLSLRHPEMVGVEIALPSRGPKEIVPRCLLGPQGALYLLENIINGLHCLCS